MLNSTQIDQLITLAERLVTIAEKRWATPTPEEKPRDAEIWKRGDKPKQAETREEYREMPAEATGRFAGLVSAATGIRGPNVSRRGEG